MFAAADRVAQHAADRGTRRRAGAVLPRLGDLADAGDRAALRAGGRRGRRGRSGMPGENLLDDFIAHAGLLELDQGVRAGIEAGLGRANSLQHGGLAQPALHHLDDVVVRHRSGQRE